MMHACLTSGILIALLLVAGRPELFSKEGWALEAISWHSRKDVPQESPFKENQPSISNPLPRKPHHLHSHHQLTSHVFHFSSKNACATFGLVQSTANMHKANEQHCRKDPGVSAQPWAALERPPRKQHQKNQLHQVQCALEKIITSEWPDN